MKKFDGDRKYFYWGLTAFLVIAACILLYLLVAHWNVFASGVSSVFVILSPFIWGFVIAYLLRPVMRIVETYVSAPLGGAIFPKNERRAFGFGRTAAIILSEAFLIFIIVMLLRLVLPQIYSSIESIISNSGTFYNNFVTWASNVLEDYPQLETMFVNVVGNASDSLIEWAKTTLLPQMTSLITNITSGVYYFIRSIYYIVVGVIASVYILFNKEAVSTGSKKLVYSIFSLGAAEKILNAVRFSDRIFMNFISGKLLDSLIVGVLCYISCLILKMPYAILVSVIVGVTNIIPFFGPFIGAIPSAIIILTVSPMKCLVFVILILVLQQFDGNILGPRILGGSIGINGFWIMFSIILGGGLFGFAGMLLGVPVFMVIYTGVKSLIDRRLRKNGLPTEAVSYENLLYIDPGTGEHVERPPEPSFEERREAKAKSREEDKVSRTEKAARLMKKWRSARKKDREKPRDRDGGNQE